MPMMGIEILLFLGLLFHDYTITHFLNKKKLTILQKDHEESFLERNKAFLKERLRQWRKCEENSDECHPPPEEDFIPLTYKRQDSDHVIHLCMNRFKKWSPYYHWNKRNVDNYQPEIQTQRLVFQHQDHDMKPVRTQIIRCTEKYAIMEADGERSHYLLVNYDKRSEKEYWGIESEDLFIIFMKFTLNPKKKGSSKNGQTVDEGSSKNGQTVDEGTQNEKLHDFGRSNTV